MYLSQSLVSCFELYFSFTKLILFEKKKNMPEQKKILKSQLTQDQIDFFHREGYLLINGFFNKLETQKIAKLSDEAAAWPEVTGKYMKYHENNVKTGERQLCRIENFTPYSEELNNLCRNERVYSLLEDLKDPTKAMGLPVKIAIFVDATLASKRTLQSQLLV